MIVEIFNARTFCILDFLCSPWRIRCEQVSFSGAAGVALGVAMASALLAATWIAPDIAGFPVEVRSVLAILFLLAFCMHTKGRFRFPVLWLDVVAVSILLVGVVSDWRFGGIGVDSPIRLYGEFVLPYFTDALLRCVPMFLAMFRFFSREWQFL